MNDHKAPARQVYSVSEITGRIKNFLEEKFPLLWVEGEVSNLRQPTSGHIYFTLKDEQSQLQAVMFRFRHEFLKFRIEDGLKIMVFGKLSVYEKSGQYQIIVEEAVPKGLGSLQLAFEQLKKKLAAEGLFDPGHKIPIPLLPQRIGIVTSPTGAAFQDILKVMKRRFSNVEILLYPVPVQGEGAAEAISRAISELDNLGEVEVIMVGRGGGSLEDLWAFNEEAVARAIYACRTPIISAVGHEIDWTIADLVADLRAPTPSAAAEMVIAKKEEFLEKLGNFSNRLKYALDSFLEKQRLSLENLRASFGFRHPLDLIRQYEQRIDEIRYRLQLRLEHKLNLTKERMASVLRHLEALSPLGILKRGYSITFNWPEHEVIKNVTQVSPGQKIETSLSAGKIISEILEIKE